MLPSGVTIRFITACPIPSHSSVGTTPTGGAIYQETGVSRIEIYGLGSDNLVYKLNNGNWQQFYS